MHRETVDGFIRQAALQAADSDKANAALLEEFLRTGQETWDGAGSGSFTWAQVNEAGVHSRRAETALRVLFGLLAGLLPEEAKALPLVSPKAIRERVSPLVKGLLPADWQDVALRELSQRVFVLNFQGAKKAMEAEMSWIGNAWSILWAYFEDFHLKPDGIEIEWCGVTPGEFAHIRWSVYEPQNPYSDVVVHEAAHLLHLLKPEHFELRIKRGQERFVDVEFIHRELFAYSCEAYTRILEHGARKDRVAFAESICKAGLSFPEDVCVQVADLILIAARSRNGWKRILEATIEGRKKILAA